MSLAVCDCDIVAVPDMDCEFVCVCEADAVPDAVLLAVLVCVGV